MANNFLQDNFFYVYSCDLDVNVQIKIGTLEGIRSQPKYTELLNNPILYYSGACQDENSDLNVTCQVYTKGRPLALSVQTSYKPFSTRWNWNEWLTLPIKYSELPRDALLVITIYDICDSASEMIVGGTSISLFGKKWGFRQGIYDLKVWPGLAGDGCIPSSTPGKIKCEIDEMSRIAKLSKKHRNGHLAKIDWLDRLTFREIEMINERQKRESNQLFLMIEFPRVVLDQVEYMVVYYEKDADMTTYNNKHGELVTVYDPDLDGENVVEDKHYKLVRSLRTGPLERDLKPNSGVRDRLNILVSYPQTAALSSEDKDLIWTFRFYLSTQKKALTKFLRSVQWKAGQEVKQALDLLQRWNPIDPEDALELLTPVFTHPTIRMYAVTRLSEADDEDLLIYLLQLVQALKYENLDELGQTSSFIPFLDSPMNNNLDLSINISTTSLNNPNINKINSEFINPDSNFELLNSNLESLTLSQSPLCNSIATTNDHQNNTESMLSIKSFDNVEGRSIDGARLKKMGLSYMTSLGERSQVMGSDPTLNHSNSKQSQALLDDAIKEDTNKTTRSNFRKNNMDLASFLIYRACHNAKLANYFYWFLKVEFSEDQENQLKDPHICNMYHTVLLRFSRTLATGCLKWRQMRSSLIAQEILVDKIVQVVRTVSKEGMNRLKKIERLQSLLSFHEPGNHNLLAFDPIPLPLDPDILVNGVDPESATIFKSALNPCRLSFKTISGDPSNNYITIFKHGDDLRQDQLVLQIINLMDRLLRKENLDLKLTPYKVLATSSKHGFVQFIESISVAEILSTDGGILQYFKKIAFSDNSSFGVSQEIMDNYIKSCAGYCVITYILGVGDRHFDNLLITKTGKLFHIDFGYILGRDPKPLQPPMKLSKEMVEAMGGVSSEYFADFKQLCYTAFLHLRRSANLILNLFSLMVNANVPDIALEPDKTVKKVQDKFQLELTDEQAVQYMQNLIDLSISATAAAFIEQMHKFTQYLRK